MYIQGLQKQFQNTGKAEKMRFTVLTEYYAK